MNLKILNKKTGVSILSYFLLAPIIISSIPPFIPVISADDVPEYALDFAGGTFWYLDHGYSELTYFSFYTFFQKGIEPDCIDMKEDNLDMEKEYRNEFQV